LGPALLDPPDGWRFDMSRRRVIVVEKLASEEDIPDPTLNGGTVEFANDGKPGQIMRHGHGEARTKTGRPPPSAGFEATLERIARRTAPCHSGVRALDCGEAVRVPLDPSGVEWKLYVRLFDEIDREFEGKTSAGTPFLHITTDPGGGALVLQADPQAVP